MRKAERAHYLKTLEKKECPSRIVSVSTTSGKYTFPSKSINVLSGLNGSGKSTLFAIIKTALGIPMTEAERRKATAAHLKICLKLSDDMVEVDSDTKMPLTTNPEHQALVKSFDSKSVHDALAFFSSQSNLTELLDQYEPTEPAPGDFLCPEEMSALVGKEYQSVSFSEIEIQDNKSYPFFIVTTSDNEQYDVSSMGLGEYQLFYLMWILTSLEKDGILLLDEPDSAISYQSCMMLPGILAKVSVKKHTSIYCTSHLPYLSDALKNGGQTVISRNASGISLSNSSSVSMSLGLPAAKRGCFLVEDEIAQELLTALLAFHSTKTLRTFRIIQMNGASEIVKFLQQVNKHRDLNDICLFIGVFDGDLENGSPDADKLEELENVNYLFLPGAIPMEQAYRNFLKESKSFFQAVMKAIPCKQEALDDALHGAQGADYHDWPAEMASYLGIDTSTYISVLSRCWVEVNKDDRAVLSFFDAIDDLYMDKRSIT